MSQKKFIESLGATCDNWRWSWSYVNHDERFVVFGAWDIFEEGFRCKIFENSWQIKKNGRRNGGFLQSKRHIELIEEKGYSLKTFRIFHSEGNPITGTAKRQGYVSQEVERHLVREGNAWFAYAAAVRPELAEGIGGTDPIFLEGKRKNVSGTAIERNHAARKECLRIYNLDCQVCGFNFEKVFGSHGIGFIHVHHLNPVAASKGEYTIDPANDLRPVCPNCHAMLHRSRDREPLTIEELKSIMQETSKQ